MPQSTIALIITAVVFILYLTEVFPVATTTMFGMLAFIFTGILTFDEAFACFTSAPVMLTLGVIIIANSLVESGIGSMIEQLMEHIEKRSEKFFALVVLLTTAV